MSDNLNALIDAYAFIKLQLADLEIQKRAIEKSLADLPAGAYESEHHRLTISDSLRVSPDDAMKEEIANVVDTFKATLSRQYLAAHTVETSVRTHRIGARNGKGLAA
jgi:hypothetical protein